MQQLATDFQIKLDIGIFATIQRRESAKFSGSLGVDSLETSEVRENDESTSIEAFDPATRVSAMNCSNSTFASANNSRVRSSRRWVFGVSGELRCVLMLRFGVLNGESVLMLLPGVRPPLLLLIESLDRGDACDAITSATACHNNDQLKQGRAEFVALRLNPSQFLHVAATVCSVVAIEYTFRRKQIDSGQADLYYTAAYGGGKNK
uniref:Uncharacterized protein n=1 Tax=Glossina austeni TaxID=7395 RepID=A0A1A9VRY5_GLOAU